MIPASPCISYIGLSTYGTGVEGAADALIASEEASILEDMDRYVESLTPIAREHS